MKKMPKTLTVFLCVVMSVSLMFAACKTQGDSNKETTNKDSIRWFVSSELLRDPDGHEAKVITESKNPYDDGLIAVAKDQQDDMSVEEKEHNLGVNAWNFISNLALSEGKDINDPAVIQYYINEVLIPSLVPHRGGEGLSGDPYIMATFAHALVAQKAFPVETLPAHVYNSDKVEDQLNATAEALMQDQTLALDVGDKIVEWFASASTKVEKTSSGEYKSMVYVNHEDGDVRIIVDSVDRTAGYVATVSASGVKFSFKMRCMQICEPVPVKPNEVPVTQPTSTESATTSPSTTKPSTTKPTTTESSTTKPSTTKPSTTKPSTTKPSTTKPTTTKPTTTLAPKNPNRGPSKGDGNPNCGQDTSRTPGPTWPHGTTVATTKSTMEATTKKSSTVTTTRVETTTRPSSTTKAPEVITGIAQGTIAPPR